MIVMTDSLEPSVEGECLEAGAEDFLSRPMNFQIAHSRIDRIIELNCLKEELQEAMKDPLTGMCNRSYAELYNAADKALYFSKQNGKTQLMLVSLQDNHSDRVSQELLESEIQNLEDSIVRSLRRNDVSTRYSNRQILVVLIDIDGNKMNIVRNRISENYKKSRKSDYYTVAFEQMPIERSVRRVRGC